ncbi:MAG TPA: sigma factor [Streptosporangiaceae bacterium]|nr:sigma factor [Streptosporangiaceae bacterium]
MHLDDVVTELVEHCGDRLLRVAYQLTHDAAAAQDLVQEALLRVYQSVRHRGLAPEDWYTYLRRAVINEYVRTRRPRSPSSSVVIRPSVMATCRPPARAALYRSSSSY